MKRVVGVVTIILTIGSITAGCGGDDQANAIDETVQSFAAALTNGDVQAIAAAYTDKGLAEDQHVGSREEFLASNPDDVKQAIELTDVVARVEGDAATVDVSGVAEDSYIFKYRYPMVDIDGEWKFDGAGVPLEVPIPDGAKAIDLQLSDFAFAWQPTEVTSGEVAFRIENVGQQPHEAVLVKVAEGVNLQDALFSEGPPAGIEFLGFTSAEPGQSNTLVFTRPLDAGHYAFVCFFPDLEDPAMTPHAFKGMVSEFDVPST